MKGKSKGFTEKISDLVPNNIISGNDFVKKIANLRAARKAAQAIPGVGALAGIAAGLESGDVAAAVPVLNEAENLGPERGTPEFDLESGNISPEDKKRYFQDSPFLKSLRGER